ncbi:gamma carbonic anhydrase family protein [Petroclostridium sp. X23]|uniref:gamma carbonic anhydrase family protein n=1 Tax=Petroclostridium sp. X23 TaxID=3045146 RepID=UPI0024AD5D9B|nr:gamma carbonic anhydrase family protein [Petroclostridium sp. X23]WHH59052.1 gamma carbonic anhydrase family protein [Petroclostridium sp. X23]
MILNYSGTLPKIHESCFIAPSADVIGKVQIGKDSSIWFKTVLRGDVASIIIGKNSNIQDGSIVHCGYNLDTIIGNNVVIGHNAIIHGCRVGDNCLIGMGAIILNGAVIGENCIIGAGALVTLGKEIPPNSMVLGSPAKVVRELTAEEIESIYQNAQRYVMLGREYK